MKIGMCALIAGLLMLSATYAEEPEISAGKVLENLARTDSSSATAPAMLATKDCTICEECNTLAVAKDRRGTGAVTNFQHAPA
jgi:hypothetical protein